MLPAGPGVDHAARHPLGAEEDVPEVGPVEGVPAVLGGLEKRRQNTPPALLTRMMTGPSSAIVRASAASTCGAVADVGGDAERADLFGGRRAGLGVVLPDRDLCAERGEAGGDAAADPGATAGHDRDATRRAARQKVLSPWTRQ